MVDSRNTWQVLLPKHLPPSGELTSSSAGGRSPSALFLQRESLAANTTRRNYLCSIKGLDRVWNTGRNNRAKSS